MLTNWPRSFPNCEPSGHLLRAPFSDRWVRLHSLPGSKRYREGETEYAIVLDRHNRVLGELAENGETIVLLTSGYSDTMVPVRSEAVLAELDPFAAMAKRRHASVRREFLGAELSAPVWEYATLDTRGFNALVRKIANDEIAIVMMLAADCRWLVHPYDGGMDVILETSEARDKLRAKFQEWLPPRANGG